MLLIQTASAVVFKASEGFSDAQGANGWSYAGVHHKAVGDLYVSQVPGVWEPSEKRWKVNVLNVGAVYIGSNAQDFVAGNAIHSLRVWTADQDYSLVDVKGVVNASVKCGAKIFRVDAATQKTESCLTKWVPAGETASMDVPFVDIKKGDQICFLLQQSDIPASHMMQVWDPVISCTVSEQAAASRPEEIDPLHGTISKVDLRGRALTLETTWNQPIDGKLWIAFIQNGALYNSELREVKGSRFLVFEMELPDNLPAGWITVECVPVNLPTATPAVGRIFVGDAEAAESPQARAWGVYRDRDECTHPWYVTKSNMMMWDGTPYIPMGGMMNTLCSWKTRAGDLDDSAEVKTWRKALVDRLTVLKVNGITDIYFNGFFPRSNPHELQEMVNVAEKLGMKYGVHVSQTPKRTSNGFVRDEDYVVRIPAGAKKAVIDVPLARGLYAPPHRCIWYVLAEDEIVEFGIGELTAGNLSNLETNQLSLSLPVKLEAASAVERTLIFLPELPISDRDPSGYFAGFDDHMRLVKEVYGSLEFGPGLRMWIDPYRNEMHYAPKSVCTAPKYQEGYAAWLMKKHGRVEELNRMWGSRPDGEVPDYITAARLIPLDEERADSIWMDPQTESLYRFSSANSGSFRDLKEYRGRVCEQFISAAADGLKDIVDVPVVVKHNRWLSDWFINPRESGGLDAVGMEPYGHGDSLAYHNSLVTYAEGLSSGRSQWIFTTESSSACFERQVEGFAYIDRLQMMDNIDLLMMFGAKGFYHFAFDFGVAGSEYMSTELVRDIRQVEWLATHGKRYQQSALELAEYTPEVYGWYPAYLREKEIIEGEPSAFEMDGNYTGVSTQIRMAPDGRWIVPAVRPDAEWKALIVGGDLLTPSQLKELKLLPKDKRVIFLTNRPAKFELPAHWVVAPLDGFTSQGIGIVEPDRDVMTLDRFRKEVLDYQVFQTEALNGQTLPDGRVMVWLCSERKDATFLIPATARAETLSGQPISLTREVNGASMTLVRPDYKKVKEDRPYYLTGDIFFRDFGQPEVAVLSGVSADEIIKLNSPATYRWLPAQVEPNQVSLWVESEDFSKTTFTQPRLEGYSRYSNGSAIGINTHFGPPAGKTFSATYWIQTENINDAVFWLRKMDAPSMDVEVWIDGKRSGSIQADVPLSDLYQVNPWNSGIGVDNIKVGWVKLQIGSLAKGTHRVELVCPDQAVGSMQVDTGLMGGDAAKDVGELFTEQSMRCIQLDAFMITR